MRIKKGDTIVMLTGKDRAKKGTVERVLPVKERLIVAGLNMVKRHRKPRKQGEKGSIVEVPGSVNVSNVAMVCPSCQKVTRVGYVVDVESGKKSRQCKKCRAVL